MSKAAQTKAFIIEQTAPVFNVKGYAGTALSDLTKVTGLSKGSIYGNFENKDEVALSAFDYNLQKIDRIMNDEMATQSTCRGKLLCYVKIYSNLEHYPFPEGGCPVLNTAIEADDTHPRLKAKAAGAIYSWKTGIENIILAGIKNGEFKKDANAEQTALTIIAMIEGSIMIAGVTKQPSYIRTVITSVQAMINDL